MRRAALVLGIALLALQALAGLAVAQQAPADLFIDTVTAEWKPVAGVAGAWFPVQVMFPGPEFKIGLDVSWVHLFRERIDGNPVTNSGGDLVWARTLHRRGAAAAPTVPILIGFGK